MSSKLVVFFISSAIWFLISSLNKWVSEPIAVILLFIDINADTFAKFEAFASVVPNSYIIPFLSRLILILSIKEPSDLVLSINKPSLLITLSIISLSDLLFLIPLLIILSTFSGSLNIVSFNSKNISSFVGSLPKDFLYISTIFVSFVYGFFISSILILGLWFDLCGLNISINIPLFWGFISCEYCALFWSNISTSNINLSPFFVWSFK